MFRLQGQNYHKPSTLTGLRLHAATTFFIACTLTPVGVMADGHETVDSLKAQLAGLEKKFGAVTKDRDALYDQLLAAIEEIEGLETKVADVSTGRDHIREQYFALTESSSQREADLQAEIESEQDTGDFLGDRIQALLADSKKASAAAAAEQEKASAETDLVAETSLAQIQNALKQRDAALASSASAKNGRQLTRNQLVAAKEESSKLRNQLSFLNIQLAKAENDASSSQKNATNLENKLSFANIRLARAETDFVSVQDQLGSVQNQLNFSNIQLAKSEGDLAALQSKSDSYTGPAPDWANQLSGSLSSLYRGLDDVEVSELPGNRVAIRIGNNGLFGSGAAILSAGGKNLLSRLGDALLAQTDARILVLGHTDDVPVGSNSSYVDNTDLSNRRALQAMRHLGDVVGLSFERLSSTGLADNYPIASNDTVEGRALNRRIELELSPIQ